MAGTTVEQLRAKLHDLRHSWAYAFACGHGGTYAPDPRLDWVFERELDLVAQIAELE
jgi:hypothetical protein